MRKIKESLFLIGIILLTLFSCEKEDDPKNLDCVKGEVIGLFECGTGVLIQIKNRLSQKGILKRFTTKCYGKQETMEDIRAQKAFLYNKLKKNKCDSEFQKYFLRYTPSNKSRCFTKKYVN